MIRRVLDASVAAAWYLPESFGSEAKRWQRMLLDGKAELYVPSLQYWEFARFLRTYVRRRILDTGIAAEIYALHQEAPLLPAEPSRTSILELALKYDTTAHDAVCIALSLELQIPLLTAERPTSPWVKRLGKLAIHSADKLRSWQLSDRGLPA
jgi:predicted nucleic acid-binding protein